MLIEDTLIGYNEVFRITEASKTSDDISTVNLSITKLLTLSNGVTYGSYSLNLPYSKDVDIAFSYESSSLLYNSLMSHFKDYRFNPTNYFKVHPESGYKALFRLTSSHTSDPKDSIDILFVHTDEDLDCIRSSVNDLKCVPSYLLEDKLMRINLYQNALLHRGWKRIEDTFTEIPF